VRGFSVRPTIERWGRRAAASSYGRPVARASFRLADVFQGQVETYLLAHTVDRVPPSPHPLVSVCITTFNRRDVLEERAIASILRQTYDNVEVVVVGDCLSDSTPDLVGKYGERLNLRFVNLGHRPSYPSDPMDLWYAKGNYARNVARMLAQGEWIVPMDDDDELMPGHISRLLAEASATGAEFIWGKAEYAATGEQVGSPPLRGGAVAMGTFMYRSYLDVVRHDPASWLGPVAGDYELIRRMSRAGVTTAFADEVVLRIFPPDPAQRPDAVPELTASG
jgi:hypothetical protein